jgi:hypothetical protein
MSQSTITEDFLEVDQPIPGQNYVCLSFISPEEVLNNKNVFFVHNFLKSVAPDYKLSLEECEEKYKDYSYNNQEQLEKEFYEKNDFRTTVRGLKVRGVYDTLKEAQVKAQVLQRKDPNFNVFIGQVGFWLPWDPNPHKIDTQEYAEQELNTLIKQYKENQDKKDSHFRENLEYVKDQSQKQVELQKKKNQEDSETVITNTSLVEEEAQVNVIEEVQSEPSVSSGLGDMDPWLKSKTS